jgi:superfamily II DNA or RNA helicase
MPERISLETAREFLDFAAGASGGVVSDAVAKEQLEGAVAIHNLLQEQSVAYLADEVGMGKTYVALGAMALLRHFQPSARIMVIAPKENIQKKWIKEWRNFVERVVTIEDLCVKSIGGQPARALVKIDSLVDLVTQASNDPDRDFILRMTSFSLALAATEGTLDKRRDALLKAVPWLDRTLIDARKGSYKRNFARAINCALPDIDLLIVDEAHNLKAGWRTGKSSSVRNTVLGCALAGRRMRDDPEEGEFRGYGSKVKKVLFLSATPIEYDIGQLWNQLDLFGFGEPWKALKDASLDHEQHKEVVRKLLIRRTAELHAGNHPLTKTEYRREWRGGGIKSHDEPLQLAGHREQLAVALIQKKVAELLGSGNANHSFQVGLLASFESFLETVSSTARRLAEDDDEADDDGLFHKSSEERAAAKDGPREGLDVSAINGIAKSYRMKFRAELPHPKMDAIVNELAQSFETGRKALVFVRRVASVDELQRKLEERYDALLFAKLKRQLKGDTLQRQIQEQIDAYCQLRSELRDKLRARDAASTLRPDEAESSSVDSFFAWFFRGQGPDRVRSGASIAAQMDKTSSAYATLLEDNHVAGLFEVPTERVCAEFAAAIGRPLPAAMEALGRRASQYVGRKKRRSERLVQMRAFQAAALSMLRETGGSLGERALTILQLAFSDMPADLSQDRIEPGAEDWLSEKTLFSELRARPGLREALWPEPATTNLAEAVREGELRRMCMATMIRKGHPIIDLFILIANRIGTIAQRTREAGESNASALASALLDELERQSVEQAGCFNSFYELSEAARHFKLILQLNIPDLATENLTAAPVQLGRVLRAQRPVAGMAGKVNNEVVRQFRMPGYPLVLITTDLLKEGEDLHTFCSSVYHYGIAWMPSELEQRVGRIDRVGSQTERRLARRSVDVNGDDLLQVYYPHLRDTVEVLQLRRVYERLNRFMRMMHEGLGAPAKERPDVDVADEGLRYNVDIAAITEPLRSAFRVSPAMLRGTTRSLAAAKHQAAGLHARFDAIEQLLTELGARGVRRREGHQIVGELRVGERVQPITLLLRSFKGRPVLRGVSPIGHIDTYLWDDARAAKLMKHEFVRIALEANERYESYDVAVEGDMLLGDGRFDRERAQLLIRSIIEAADTIERELLGHDYSLPEVEGGINAEVSVAR